MRVRFRLRQLLERQQKTGHGLITRIKNATTIERHKVSKLLDDKEDKISLQHLGELCRFLIEHCEVSAESLPGALFELEPDHFLELLRMKPSLRTCFGVRQRDEAKPEAPWLSGTDLFLHGKLLQLLIQRGVNHLESFHQEQVHAPSASRINTPDTFAQEMAIVQEDAARVYAALHRRDPDSTEKDEPREVEHVTLLLGTLKSNPACELATARTFQAVPWGAHGKSVRDARGETDSPLVKTPQQRAVPFFIRFREPTGPGDVSDPRVPSCYAGLRLAQGKVGCGDNCRKPGIYYETTAGWECAEWNKDSRDAALIMYDYNRTLGDVEVVMGGFSSRATLLLAERLEQIAGRLLPDTLDPPESGEDLRDPPIYATDSRAIGVFVIEFHLSKPAQTETSDVKRREVVEMKIIPLSPDVLARRQLSS